MNPYGVRDVERLLRLPRSTIRALIDAGFVSPARGPRAGETNPASISARMVLRGRRNSFSTSRTPY